MPLNMHPVKYPRTAIDLFLGIEVTDVRPTKIMPEGSTPEVYLAEMVNGFFRGLSSAFKHEDLLFTDYPFRVSPAVKYFMRHLARHGTTQQMHRRTLPWPSVKTLQKMERAGLFTTVTVEGLDRSVVEFTITKVGRKFVAMLPKKRRAARAVPK